MKDLYVIGPVNGPYKIGVSNNPMKRIAELQIGCPQFLRIHAVKPSVGIAEERRMHRVLGEYRGIGEWFDCPLEVIEVAAGIDTSEPDEVLMSAASFNKWILESQNRPPFKSERDCRQSLGMSVEEFDRAKTHGGDLRLALACRTAFHGMDPYA